MNNLLNIAENKFRTAIKKRHFQVQLQTQLHENKYKGLRDAIRNISHQSLVSILFSFTLKSSLVRVVIAFHFCLQFMVRSYLFFFLVPDISKNTIAITFLLQSKGFFRGLSYPLFSYGVVNSIFFGVYGNALRWLDRGKKEKKSSNLNIYLAGCIGGAAQLVVLVPVDLVKVLLQSQIPHPTKGIYIILGIQMTFYTHYKKTHSNDRLIIERNKGNTHNYCNVPKEEA